MDDLSPAVERAADAAAARGGADGPTLADWLAALLADDEGRPFELLARLGADVPRLLTGLPGEFAAPSRTHLMAAARKLGVRLKGDPAPTTDLVMLAVLGVDDRFAAALRPFGVTVPAVEAAVRSPLVDAAPVGRVESSRPDGSVFLPSPLAREGPGVRGGAAPGDDAPSPGVRSSPSPLTPIPQGDRGTGASGLEDSTRPTTPDLTAAARVVDANLNRGRESLRVLDDYARFVLADPTLTERLKALRHRLAALAAGLPPSLLASRDTPGDVGTAVSAGGEYARESPRQVAAVNFRRLQESLRSVEEYGKLFGPDVGRAAEAMRYEAYTLERAVLIGGTARERLAAARLYVLLSADGCALSLERTIAEAAAGGADVVQLREKNLPDRELVERARRVRAWTRAADVLFVVNDRPDVARLADADGVHLGQDDMGVADARRVLGPDSLIGVSTHTVEQVRRAVLDGADYIGVGPTFPSGTKAFDTLAGPGFVTAAVQATSLPAFVLGGIDAGTIAAAVAAGAKRVAVGGAVARSDTPRAAAAALRAALPADAV